MQSVIADITMSVDGYVSGPDDDIGHLHDWVFAGDEAGVNPRVSATGIDAEILTDSFESRGAVVMGRRTYDVTDGWGGDPPFLVPCFVITHRPHERIVCENGTTFDFIVDGPAAAVALARAAAGSKDVSVMGGAATISGLLDAGLVDELHLHIAPRVVGGGIRLFESMSREIALEEFRTEVSPWATHVFYSVI